MQTIGGREPLHGDLGRFYDAIENPRRTRGELPILRDAELRAYLADVRERTLDVLDGVELDADAEDPLLRDGFVYEMLLAHELQHNETMLQLLQMVDGYEPAAGRPRPSAEPARRTGPRRSPSTPASTRSAPPPRLRLRQRAPPPHGRARRLRDRPRPGHQRAPTPRFVEETGAEPPMYWERDGEAGSHRAGRASRSTRPPRHPRLLGRGRRLRPLGRQAAAHRAGVGGRRARAGGGRPRLGVDLLRLPRLPRLRGLPLPGVLARSSSATTTGCCAAAPGRPTRA